jgi:hypothetical protein
MSKIETDGFLSKEACDGRNVILTSYRDAFLLAKDLNRASMRLFCEYSLSLHNKVKIAIAALMPRIVETYQGVIIMLEKGMTSQAKMLVRSQLEALFRMAALVKNQNLYASYAAEHFISTIKALKAARRWKQKSLNGRLAKEKIDELISENEKKLKEVKANPLKIYEWANEAELSDFYNVFYVENSSAIHSDMSALDDHLSRDSRHGLQVSFGPNDIDLYHILRTSISVMLSAMESFSVAQEIEIAESIKKLGERAAELDKTYYVDVDDNREETEVRP